MNDLHFDKVLQYVTNRQRHQAAWTVAVNTEDSSQERARLLQMVGLALPGPDGFLKPTIGDDGQAPWR